MSPWTKTGNIRGPQGPVGATGPGTYPPTTGFLGDVLTVTTDGAAPTWAPTAPISDSKKVDKDSVVVAATRIVQNMLAVGDAQPAFWIGGDGKHQWGAGGASAPDVTLYRSAAATLTTPGALTTGAATGSSGSTSTGAGTYQGPGGSFASVRSSYGYALLASLLGDAGTWRFAIDSNGKQTWADGVVSTSDTNLYRAAANMLKTDGSMLATAGFNAAGMAAAGTPALQASVSGDSQVRFVLAANGQMQWGPGGTTAVDTYLVRAGANVLQTSGTLIAGSGFNANGMTGVGSWAYQASVSGDTQPRFYIRADGVHAWGPGNAATDTSLQRWYAGAIYTPNVLGIGLNIRVYHGSVTTALTTEVGGDTQSRFLFDTNGHLQWGPGGSTAPDTNLYRSGAGILKTDGHLLVGQSIQMDRSGAGNAIYFGSANDTYLVRAGANVLQASGSLNVSQYVFAGANTGSGNWSFLARVSGDTNNRWDVMNQGLMHWGDGVNSPDTNLYRSAAGVLKTDGKIEAAGGFTVGGAAVGGVPSGSIIPYAGSAAPSGWVLADGTAYPRTGGTYDALFAAIGTTFGAGDGSTTFNVPDMRGRMPVSVGTHADVSTRGNNEGSAVASRRPKHPHSSALTFAGSGGATAIENAVHSHNVSDPGHNHNAYAGTTGGSNYTIQSFSNNDAGAVSSTTIAVAGTGISLSTETANHQHAFTPAGSIGGTIGAAGVANDAPAYLTLNFIVKL